MPATWRVQIVKSYQGEVWSNDWLTEIVPMADVLTFANTLVTFERSIHSNAINFEYMRISTMEVGDRRFRHVPLNLMGNSGAAMDHLPLYCVMRMDMQTIDSDPCRKYFRCPVNEADQVNGIFTTTAMSFWTPKIAATLTPAVLANIVSSKGNGVISASFYNRVQMRQLHRRKRPKMTQAQFNAQ